MSVRMTMMKMQMKKNSCYFRGYMLRRDLKRETNRIETGKHRRNDIKNPLSGGRQRKGCNVLAQAFLLRYTAQAHMVSSQFQMSFLPSSVTSPLAE